MGAKRTLALTVLRREKGLTQTDLARLVGASQTEISNIECGLVQPHENLAPRLRSVFDVPRVEDLLKPYEEYIRDKISSERLS